MTYPSAKEHISFSPDTKEQMLQKIENQLRIRNQIEWLKAMIEYSDEPEKYKALLKEVWIQRE